MLSSNPENELSIEGWLRVAGELNPGTRIMLWGGEPLLWPEFDRLSVELYRRKFELSIVTNGTLIHHHAEVLNKYFSEIFLSIDGDREDHDRVRGEGVFATLQKNIPLLSERRGKLSFMTVILDEKAAELPLKLAYLKPDEWIFSQLIYVSRAEYAEYQQFSPYPELSAWIRDDDSEYCRKLSAVLALIEENRSKYPMPVHVTPHHYPEQRFDDCRCPAMDRRLHIRHDGETTFCTDFFGISLGNIREHRIQDIFTGEKAEKLRIRLREGLLPICRHCPWLGQKFTGLPESMP